MTPTPDDYDKLYAENAALTARIKELEKSEDQLKKLIDRSSFGGYAQEFESENAALAAKVKELTESANAHRDAQIRAEAQVIKMRDAIAGLSSLIGHARARPLRRMTVDKYDEQGEALCLTWTNQHRKIVAPVEIPCGMCQVFAAALRESAAEAWVEAGSSDYEYDQVHADWCFAKAAALRSAATEKK